MLAKADATAASTDKNGIRQRGHFESVIRANVATDVPDNQRCQMQKL